MQLPSKRGISYPLDLDGNGNLAISTDYDLVREHIVSVIETRPYERVFRQDYGLPDQAFKVIQPEVIDTKIAMAIERQVTEIEDLKVFGVWLAGEDGIYQVSIFYTLNGVPQPKIELSLQA